MKIGLYSHKPIFIVYITPLSNYKASLDDKIAWYENDGAGNFTKYTIDNNLDGAMHVHITDINGDGNMDIAASAVVADQIVWYENDGVENFTKHIVDAAFNSASGVYADDLDCCFGVLAGYGAYIRAGAWIFVWETGRDQ